MARLDLYVEIIGLDLAEELAAAGVAAELKAGRVVGEMAGKVYQTHAAAISFTKLIGPKQGCECGSTIR